MGIVLSVLAVAAAIPYRPPCGIRRPPIYGPGGLPPQPIEPQDPIVGPGGLPPQERIIGPEGIYRPKPAICGPRIIPVRRPCGYRPVRFCRRPVRYCRPIRRF